MQMNHATVVILNWKTEKSGYLKSGLGVAANKFYKKTKQVAANKFYEKQATYLPSSKTAMWRWNESFWRWETPTTAAPTFLGNICFAFVPKRSQIWLATLK